MSEATITRYCSRCGTAGECAEGGMPPGWSFEVEDRRLTYTCDRCLRENLRAIEAKLPQEYWEF